jgi:soluble cytochrome b562
MAASHIDLIKELQQEKDIDQAKSLVSELNTSYKTYHQYFQ